VSGTQGVSERHVPGLRDTIQERWDILAVIAVGGAVGSLGRWALAQAIPHDPSEFPVSTLVVNVVGSFALGLLMVLVLEVWPPTRYARPFLGVGVMGGFTTFSTFMFDNRALGASGEPVLIVVYVVATVVLVLLAVAAGVLAARTGAQLLHRRHARRAGDSSESEIE